MPSSRPNKSIVSSLLFFCSSSGTEFSFKPGNIISPLSFSFSTSAKLNKSTLSCSFSSWASSVWTFLGLPLFFFPCSSFCSFSSLATTFFGLPLLFLVTSCSSFFSADIFVSSDCNIFSISSWFKSFCSVFVSVTGIAGFASMFFLLFSSFISFLFTPETVGITTGFVISDVPIFFSNISFLVLSFPVFFLFS